MLQRNIPPKVDGAFCTSWLTFAPFHRFCATVNQTLHTLLSRIVVVSVVLSATWLAMLLDGGDVARPGLSIGSATAHTNAKSHPATAELQANVTR